MAMSTSKKVPHVDLPTLERLGLKSAPNISQPEALSVAQQWLGTLGSTLKNNNVPKVLDLFVADAFWRDALALTWNIRTFSGHEKIGAFLESQSAVHEPSNFEIDPQNTSFQTPFPDLAWIQAFFKFTTKTGLASGIVRLIPTSSDGKSWKAHTIFTNLEDLKGHPEKVGQLRNFEPNHGLWMSQRQAEINLADGKEPTVVIVGGGQSGLDVATRLKVLGVNALVVEKEARVGDQWRNRYQALCLHDPVWYNHMPYIPFPATWPVYTPAAKLADWLESYAHSMELNVWTNASVEHLKYDDPSKTWTVEIIRNGEKRTMKPKYIIIAAGFGGNTPNMPDFPGMNDFKGKVVHSTAYKSAKDYLGKKALVIGACTSGHDIAQDLYVQGIEATLYQRSSTYVMTTKNGVPLIHALYSEGGLLTDVADRINASFPNHFIKPIATRITTVIKEQDRELLDDLEKVGFKLNFGEDGSGALMLAWSRGGGYYLEVGASRLVADGKIKLKSSVPIKRFVADGVEFEDGSKVEADVVVFATGFGDARDHVRTLADDELVKRLKPVWGLDEEGELNSLWKDSGHPGLWFMMGNLALCRFYSRHVALQIKALEEGIFDGKRY